MSMPNRMAPEAAATAPRAENVVPEKPTPPSNPAGSQRQLETRRADNSSRDKTGEKQARALQEPMA